MAKIMKTNSDFWSCLFCSKVFGLKESLYYHLRSHTGEKPNFCRTCSYEGGCHKYIRKHEKYVCQKALFCPHCESTFTVRKDLIQHRTYDCVKLPYKCKICKRGLKNPRALKQHNFLLHKPTLTTREERTCLFCLKYHHELRNLNSHLLKHIGERPYECNKCNFATTSEVILQSHQAVHVSVKSVKCNSCDEVFADVARLRNHRRRRHDKPKVLISCTMCNYSTYYLDDFKSHLRSHTNEKHFKCDICDKELTTKATLKNHRLIHFPDKNKIYSCSICDKTFKYSSGLYTHKKIHSESRLYACKLCPKSLKTIGSLKGHMDIHTRGIMVKCRACPVTLANRAERHEHELQCHANENPQMRCDICRKPIRKFDFQDHLDSHKKAKRHWCIFCDKNFLRPGELAVHTRGHISEFPSWCHICGHEFKRDRPNLMRKHKCSKQ